MIPRNNTRTGNRYSTKNSRRNGWVMMMAVPVLGCCVHRPTRVGALSSRGTFSTATSRLQSGFARISNPNSFFKEANQQSIEKKKQGAILATASSTRLFVSTTDDNSPDKDDSNENIEDTKLQVQGRLLLCLVALLYGTLNVSLRMVYNVPAVAPSAAALSATRGWIAAFSFLPLLLLSRNNSRTQQSQSQQFNKTSWKPLLLGGLELAVWNGLAQGLLNAGLLSTGSARASFLTQSSVVLTPLLSVVLQRQSISKGTWWACGIALIGLGFLSGVGFTSASFSSISGGDALVLGGALAWSCYLLRLGPIGSKFEEIPLQFVKTFLLGILYSIWFGLSFLTSGADNSFSDAMGWATGGTGVWIIWVALTYSAIGPGTAADVLQQQGQRYVSATETNILLSLEPVFAAICATLLLGEVTTLKEGIGGSLILVAALVSTLAPSSSSEATTAAVDDNGDADKRK